MLEVEVMTEAEKKFQGRRPQSTKTGNLGTALWGSIMVKTMVKTTVIKRGFRRVQRKPRREFL
jgi:hypothetical protein